MNLPSSIGSSISDWSPNDAKNFNSSFEKEVIRGKIKNSIFKRKRTKNGMKTVPLRYDKTQKGRYAMANLFLKYCAAYPPSFSMKAIAFNRA
jgi:hypothetical protein